MITVGRLISSEHPDYPAEKHSDPNYVMLYMAKSFDDIEFFLFEPGDVDYENKTINGQFCEDGEIIRKTVPIPPLVDNHYTEIDEELSRYTTLARIYPGDTKFTTYADLKNSGKYNDILIPTFQINTYDDIKTHLDMFHEVIVKPALGYSGIGVIKLAKVENQYQINEKGVLSYFSEQELAEYYDRNLSKDHILQQYIDCRTKEGNPFDIRVRVVDMGWNEWTVSLYPRCGAKKGILSNVSTGGYTIPIEYFLEREFGELWKTVHNDLLKLGREFPAHYAGLIKREIFELGLDVGITKSNGKYKFWLFEANTLPRPFDHFFGGNIGFNLLIAYFKYYRYLFQKHKGDYGV